MPGSPGAASSRSASTERRLGEQPPVPGLQQVVDPVVAIVPSSSATSGRANEVGASARNCSHAAAASGRGPGRRGGHGLRYRGGGIRRVCPRAGARRRGPLLPWYGPRAVDQRIGENPGGAAELAQPGHSTGGQPAHHCDPVDADAGEAELSANGRDGPRRCVH